MRARNAGVIDDADTRFVNTAFGVGATRPVDGFVDFDGGTVGVAR